MKKLSMTLILSAMFLIAAGAEFKLMDRGRAVCTVVLPKNADCVGKYAAEELALFLGKIAGGKAPRVSSVPEKGKYPIYLELTKDPKVGPEGFKITADKKALRIAGKEPVGILYGVYEVLKKYGGIRWLFPGKEGEYFTRRPTIKVPAVRRIKNPDFKIRDFSKVVTATNRPLWDTAAWGARNNTRFMVTYPLIEEHGEKLLKFGVIAMGGGHCFSPLLNRRHAMKNVDKRFADKTYVAYVNEQFKKHPEYYALINGKRVVSYYGGVEPQPCTSNKDVIKIVAEGLAQICKEMGKDHLFLFGNNDCVQWCQCKNCRAIDPAEETKNNVVSTRYWTFANAVLEQAKKINPNINVNGWTYQTFREYPLGVKPTNISSLITISNHRRCWKHPLDDPKCPHNGWFYRYNKRWNTLGVPLYTYEELLYGGYGFLPVEKNLVDTLKYYHKNMKNMQGMKTEIVCPDGYFIPRFRKFHLMNNWRMMWQTAYLGMYFHWDINADYDKVYEEINALYYGKGWNGGMREFRKLLTDLYMNSKGCWGYGHGVHTGYYLNVLGAKEKLLSLLASAEKAAAKDPDKRALKNVRLDRNFFERTWIRAYDDYLKNYREIRAYPRQGKIKIDGKLNEKDWKDAEFVSRFTITPGSKVLAKHQTSVRLVYDRDNFYIGIECLEPEPGKMLTKVKKHDGDVWKDNDVELFINDPILGSAYYQIMINAAGVVCDVTGPNISRAYESQAEVKTSIGKDRWFAEVRIPARNIFSGVFKQGVVLKMNVMRGRQLEGKKSEDEYSTWGKDRPNNVSMFHAINFSGPKQERLNRPAKDTRLWRNGTFNEVAKKKPLATHWKLKGGKAPANWSFASAKQYSGEMEYKLHPGSSDNYFIRLKNGFIFNTYDIKSKKIFLSCKLRGKGKLNFYVFRYSAKNRFLGSKFMKTFDAKPGPQWKDHSFVFDRPGDKSERQCLVLWPAKGAEIDIDDVLLMPKE